MAGLGLNLDDTKAANASGPLSPTQQHIEHKRSDSDETATTPSTLPYAEHGALIDRSLTADKKKAANGGLLWPRIRHIFREPFSEFLGTFILIMFGDGVVAQVVLSNGEKGDYQSISWGWVSCCRS